MPDVVCQSCGNRQTIPIFEIEPECEHCGGTEFSPADTSEFDEE